MIKRKYQHSLGYVVTKTRNETMQSYLKALKYCFNHLIFIIQYLYQMILIFVYFSLFMNLEFYFKMGEICLHLYRIENIELCQFI